MENFSRFFLRKAPGQHALETVPEVKREPTIERRNTEPPTATNFHLPIKMASGLKKPAPQFQGVAIIKGSLQNIKLDDYRGMYLVLLFYPCDFDKLSASEISDFSQRVEDFNKLRCGVIACSTDSRFSHSAWFDMLKKEGVPEINIAVIEDKNGKISKSFGCFDEDTGLSFRGLYIIDKEQILRHISLTDLPVIRSVNETLRILYELQSDEKHGEEEEVDEEEVYEEGEEEGGEGLEEGEGEIEPDGGDGEE